MPLNIGLKFKKYEDIEKASPSDLKEFTDACGYHEIWIFFQGGCNLYFDDVGSAWMFLRHESKLRAGKGLSEASSLGDFFVVISEGRIIKKGKF